MQRHPAAAAREVEVAAERALLAAEPRRGPAHLARVRARVGVRVLVRVPTATPNHAEVRPTEERGPSNSCDRMCIARRRNMLRYSSTEAKPTSGTRRLCLDRQSGGSGGSSRPGGRGRRGKPGERPQKIARIWARRCPSDVVTVRASS
eukprot:scaffold60273_cov61-Phaeocystis_antarctica.AAC.4